MLFTPGQFVIDFKVNSVITLEKHVVLYHTAMYLYSTLETL